MVTSWPITSMATWLTASGITGFTLPGMMDEPACRAGKRISRSPASGPEAISRRSPQIFNRETAWAFRIPETSTNTSAFCVASTRFSARAKPIPVSSRKVSVTRKMNCRGAANPVPMAVPPRLTTRRRSSHLYMRQRSRFIASAYAPISRPRVVRTASCN